MIKEIILFLLIILINTEGIVLKETCPEEITGFFDTPAKSNMWELIRIGNFGEIEKLITETPCLIHMRSKDQRGPLFWAYEFGRNDVVSFLVEKGTDPSERDEEGKLASEMAPSVNVNFKPSQGIL
jgi:ankyrin repeat protein